MNRRLTLEPGIRFVLSPPPYGNSVESAFRLSTWNEANKVQLIRPALVNGVRVGQHPVTGQTYPVNGGYSFSL